MAGKGQPKKIESPDLLWELAEQYFAEIDANPFKINKLITSGDLAGCIVGVPTIRPYTWSGLGVFCWAAGYNTRLDEYKSNRRGLYGDYAEVVARISERMYAQKFEGAAVGVFNQSIISADLGLVQKTLTEIKDTTEEIDYSLLSDEALEEIENARGKANE